MTFPEHDTTGEYIGRPDHAAGPVLDVQPHDAPYSDEVGTGTPEPDEPQIGEEAHHATPDDEL